MEQPTTDIAGFPEQPSPAYLSQRRQSIPDSTANGEKNRLSMLLTGHTLTPWRSADSLVPGKPGNTTPSNEKRRSLRRSKDLSAQQGENHDATSGITQRIRKFSFSKNPSTPSTPRPPPPPQYTNDVVMTNTINKDYDPATGNKVINKYMIIREIGRGVHGKVKLAEDIETGELVAIKIVDKRTRRRQLGYSLLRGNSQQHVRGGLDNLRKIADLPQYKENEQKIRREIAILKKCAHPHVVKLREVIDDPASRKIYMALEYMEGGEIEWRDENEMPVLSLDETRAVFRDVVSGLDYLHYQGIIHRDIKPANLLLSADHVVKISDFGVSYFNELLAGDESVAMAHKSDENCHRIDRELAETAGTPAFFAPELCSAGDAPLSPTFDGNGIENGNGQVAENTQQQHHHHHRPRITKAIDVWALGVTLYCLVFGRCPFTAATEFELFDVIPNEPLKFPDPEEIGFDIPENLKDLLQRLLTKNPEERITLEEVKHHPWVLEDLRDPEVWWEEADPRRYKAVEVTDEEVTHAVTIMDRLRKSIQKLSSSLSNLTHGLTRRRSKSVSVSQIDRDGNNKKNGKSNETLLDPNHQPTPSRRVSHQPIPLSPRRTSHQYPAQPNPEPLMHGKPSYSTSLLPYPVHNQHDYNTPLASPIFSRYHDRPSSYLSDDMSYNHREHDFYPDIQEHDEDEDEHEHDRPTLDRQASSASSSSGLAITISRYRGGLTPKLPQSTHSSLKK